LDVICCLEDDRNCRNWLFLIKQAGISGTRTEGRMHQETADRTVLIAGDLDDPWVGLIVTAVSNVGAVRTIDVNGPVPARLFGDGECPRTVIIHRSRLSQADISRIEGYRQEKRPKLDPEMILCYSPYVRYAELERCSQAVDLLIPEASAVDILPSHLIRDRDDPAAIPDHEHRGSIKVEVISTDPALGATLREICLAAGFVSQESSDAAVMSRSSRSGPARSGARLISNVRPQLIVTVWDVPVLEPGWPELIEHRSLQGPVIALLGFADRATVGLAMDRGAAACLDLPFNVVDLIDVIDRVSRSMLAEREPGAPARLESAHAVPPPHVSRGGKVRGRHRGIGAHVPRVGIPPPNKARQPGDPEAGNEPGAVARRRNEI
jgi:hypothetical protein